MKRLIGLFFILMGLCTGAICCETETVLVPHEALFLDQENLMVSIEGEAYEVLALSKEGEYWRIELTSAGYCQSGHNLCGNCKLCHLRRCIYYIPPCNYWR